jgi:hypothetical protein
MNDINLQWSMLINLGQTDGVNRTDFNAWQLLMRTAPLNFVRHVRVRLSDSEQRYKYVLDAIKWAKGDANLDDKFRDYQEDFRLRRVLQEINFSKSFTSLVLDAFLHLMAPASPSVLRGKERFESLAALGDRRLKVFLCHSAQDKPQVRELYQKLVADGIDPWFDEANLIPGSNWDMEIRKAIRNSDAVLILMSRSSVSKEGYVQHEIKVALDISYELPEGDIYVIPVRLEECEVPRALSKWHYADLFREGGYELLLNSLNARAQSLELRIRRETKPVATSNKE